MSGISKDIERLTWYDSGLSPERATIIFTAKKDEYDRFSEDELKGYINNSLNNLETFYNKWNEYFEKYADLLSSKVTGSNQSVAVAREIMKTWGEGVESYIEKTKQLEEKATDIGDYLDIIKGLALFRAQTLSKWFYFVHCNLYDAIDSIIRKKPGNILKEYSALCQTAAESQLTGKMFPKFPGALDDPPEVNYRLNADMEKIKESITISPDLTDKSEPRKRKVNKKHIIAVAVIVAIIVVIFVLVIFVFRKGEAFVGMGTSANAHTNDIMSLGAAVGMDMPQMMIDQNKKNDEMIQRKKKSPPPPKAEKEHLADCPCCNSDLLR
jgi:hypothetical protein